MYNPVLPGARGKTSKVSLERGQGHGGIGNQYGDTADFAKTLKDTRTA
jgi:hypothetical protein